MLLWAFRTPRHSQPLYPIEEVTLPLAIGTQYRPADSGSLSGRVVWDGDIPKVEPMVLSPTFYTPPHQPPKQNPNSIRVGADRGLVDALVYLRGVDPTLAKPWDHPELNVIADSLDVTLQQGSQVNRLGFVRRGADVSFVAREARMHSVRGRGAEYFTLPLTEPNVPIRRVLQRPGMIEITSGGEFYWARAYLCVCEHPYYTRTDARGGFTLTNVPAGQYELVVWKANWHIAKRERDPEMGMYARLWFRPPVERTINVEVKAGQGSTIAPVALRAELFTPR